MNKKWKVYPPGILRYVLLLSGILVLWWFFRSYLLFLMALAAVGGAPASLVSLWYLRDRISVQILLPGTVIGKGHSAQIKLCITNTGRVLSFPARIKCRYENLFTEYGESVTRHLWIGPGNREIAQGQVVSHHLGRVEARITEFVLWDWFHLVEYHSDRCRSAWMLAGPTALPDTEQEVAACVEGFPLENETRKRGTDVNPDYEIREYRPGDDLKSIHWKLTAKQGKTMVRERLASGRDRIHVLLALTKDVTKNDALVEALQGLGLLLLDKGYPIQLCWLGNGGRLSSCYLAEQGELENALEEILSVSGKKDPGTARTAMAAQYPGEPYIEVRSGAYQGEYIKYIQ